MDLGEKLALIQNVIYAKSLSELDASGIDETLSVVVMEGVFRKFQEAAYKTVMLHMLKKELPGENISEKQIGTPEELLQEISGGKEDVVISSKS